MWMPLRMLNRNSSQDLRIWFSHSLFFFGSGMQINSSKCDVGSVDAHLGRRVRRCRSFFHQPLAVRLTFFLLCLCVSQGSIKKTVHAFIFSASKTFFLGPSFEHRHVINSGKRRKINKEINKSAVWEQSMDFWTHDISIFFFSPSPLSYSLAWPYLFISEGSGLNETREPLKL